MDPLAEMYYNTSPYVQWGNNPVRYKDPTGMIWEDASLEEVNRLKESLTNRISALNAQMADYQNTLNSGTLSDAEVETYTTEIAAYGDMVSNLNQSIADINKLGDDQNHTYGLNSSTSTTEGYVSKGTTGTINIVGDGMQLTIHEITHVRQSLDAGRFNFSSNNKLQYTGPGVEVQEQAELEAYQKQFSVHRTDLGSGLNLRSPNDITPQIIGNIRRNNGALVYPAIHNKYHY
jgi:hypothetical protein